MKKNIQAEIKALAAELEKKWGVPALEELEDVLSDIRTHTRVIIARKAPLLEEELAKVNRQERIDMEKYGSNINKDYKVHTEKKRASDFGGPGGWATKRESLLSEVEQPKKETSPPEFFPLTPDFSERDFEKFVGGKVFEVTYRNNLNLRAFVEITVPGTSAVVLKGFPGDTVARYKGIFAVLKGTHPAYKYRGELT